MYYICYRITRNLQWCMALGTRLVPSYTNSPWWRMSACQNQIISKVKILSMHLLRPIYSTRYNYDCHSGICNRLHHRVSTSEAVSTCFQLPNWHERQKITSRQLDRWKQVFPSVCTWCALKNILKIIIYRGIACDPKSGAIWIILYGKKMKDQLSVI